MSAFGTKRTWRSHSTMSAIGGKADIARTGCDVRLLFLDFPDFRAKWMEMLVESNPKLSRAAVRWDPDTGPVQLDSVRKAARTLNVQLEVVEVPISMLLS